jgi:Zn-dependent alcohol dehydrogenase
MRAAIFNEPRSATVGDRRGPVVAERGDEAVETVKEMTGGVGVDAARSRPARAYIPELLADVLDGSIDPGRVLDYETGLDDIAEAYAAMDERRAIKSLVRVGSV